MRCSADGSIAQDVAASATTRTLPQSAGVPQGAQIDNDTERRRDAVAAFMGVTESTDIDNHSSLPEDVLQLQQLFVAVAQAQVQKGLNKGRAPRVSAIGMSLSHNQRGFKQAGRA